MKYKEVITELRRTYAPMGGHIRVVDAEKEGQNTYYMFYEVLRVDEISEVAPKHGWHLMSGDGGVLRRYRGNNYYRLYPKTVSEDVPVADRFEFTAVREDT